MDSPSGCCSSCLYPSCCSLKPVQWIWQHRELIRTGRTLQCGTTAWHCAEVNTWPRLRTCLGRTLGQPRCLILMGSACPEAWGPWPCGSLSLLVGWIGFLLIPSAALGWDEGLRRQGNTAQHCLGLGLPFAGTWSKVDGEGKGTGTLSGAGWPLQVGPGVEEQHPGLAFGG